jgi:hypothetical protein
MNKYRLIDLHRFADIIVISLVALSTLLVVLFPGGKSNKFQVGTRLQSLVSFFVSGFDRLLYSPILVDTPTDRCLAHEDPQAKH